MVIPLFLRPVESKEKPVVMLCCLVQETSDYDWCKKFSSVINNQHVKAIVFFTGNVVDQFPQLVSLFHDQVDIGSMTYSHKNITTISDYSLKLEEIKRGKLAVDLAGSIYTRSFYAPFGITDDDIYSILDRSGIVADFSYENQYNINHDGQFIKHNSKQYTIADNQTGLYIEFAKSGIPVILSVTSTIPPSTIEKVIVELKEAGVELINGSDLTGLNLTIRGDNSDYR
jgi:hypothetical protein